MTIQLTMLHCLNVATTLQFRSTTLHVAGDMNARTAGKAEVIVSDKNDVLPIFSQCFNNGVIPTEERLSKDVKLNENGRHLLNFCKLTGYVMLNG